MIHYILNYQYFCLTLQVSKEILFSLNLFKKDMVFLDIKVHCNDSALDENFSIGVP